MLRIIGKKSIHLFPLQGRRSNYSYAAFWYGIIPLCFFYYFVFTRKPAQCKENGRRQHMASGYQCVSHSNGIVRLRTLQSSRWKSGLKCRQPLGGHGRIKLRIRMSLDSIWEALAALSTWDSCPRFPELLSSAGLGSRQAKLQSDCHEGVAPSAKQAGRSTGRQRICRGTGEQITEFRPAVPVYLHTPVSMVSFTL